MLFIMASKFTCINCRVAFSDADIQRQHYKTDWHRYNLKRKVADLPPVSAEEFQRRVLLQREQEDNLNKDTSVYCNVCHKSFGSDKSFENHLNSKKHVTLSQSGGSGDRTEVEIGNVAVSTTRVIARQSESMSEEDSEIEEVDSDEWDETYSENNPILQNNCLFCKHHSATLTKNVKHLMIEHSFFIPDVEYLVDIRGLLCYLGEKIVQGFMCLWCNEKGKGFHSVEAAQQHMVDKGHCKMFHEGEALLEYADYYDYSSSYPDHSNNKEEEVIIPVIEDEDYQLVLPSGAVIGHRSLFRYYK